MKKSLLLVLVLFLTGCVSPPMRVDTPRVEASDKSYALDLPIGWIRQFTEEKNLMASRDGFPLQMIAVVKRPVKLAFPKTKKAAGENMLPSELAELEIAELKARDEQTQALIVLENEPAIIAGREGFRLKVSYRTERGLEIHEVVYGMTDKGSMYRLDYRAPKLYYFDRYSGEFENAVKSFTLGTA